jgi:myosin regulatory light chain 12
MCSLPWCAAIVSWRDEPGTDPEEVIRNAFNCFDDTNSGKINVESLRELLTTMGDRFTDEEVEEMLRGAPVDASDNLNYIEFTRIMKHGTKDRDDEDASAAT